MSAIDLLTLQAFLLALPQVEGPLPEALHQEIQQTGKALEQDQPGVAREIRELVKKHDRLNQLYETAYDRLRKEYSTQERAQSFRVEPDTVPMSWKQVAVPVLTASDFRSAARALLRRMMKDLAREPGDLRVFLVSLQQTVLELDAQAIEVLRSLEKRPLTVKGLGYLMGISHEQARDLIQQLCQAGYVDRTTSNLLHKVFSTHRSNQQSCYNFALDTYFTLTAKGHFLLHPVLTFGRRAGALLW